MTQNHLKMWVVSALFAAIIGIFAQITIPLPLVPITGQTLGIGLAVTILGLRYGVLSVSLYLLLGAIGAPVFSMMMGGLGSIVGPTGGYLIGFLPTAFFMGLYLEKLAFTKKHAIIANLIGMLITLLCGTIWLKYIAHLTWTAAFVGGFYPFLIVGVLKAVIAALIGVDVRNRLMKARVLLAAK